MKQGARHTGALFYFTASYVTIRHMQAYTIPDITPNGAAVQISTKVPSGFPTRAVWVSMTATGTTIRYGDSTVTTGRGQLLQTAVAFNACPRGDNPQQPYDLSNLYVFGASGSDKVSITYGY